MIFPVCASRVSFVQGWPVLAPGELLLFLKFYDPLTESLRFMGTHVALNTHTLGDLVPALIACSGLSAGQELAVFEEVGPALRMNIYAMATFHAMA